jgi:hypothetical protein
MGSRIVLAIVVFAALAGCGASLVYPRLDSLVGLYISGLVSLDDSQSAKLARTLERNLEWHRSEELARYEAFLRQMSEQVASGVTREGLEQAAARAETYWRRIFEQAAPGYTALAATLTDAQVRELLRSVERADEKTWREWSHRSSEDRYEHREKSLRRNIERMTGPLDPQQRQLVHEYAWSARPFMFEWRENRRLWREELAATLRLRKAGEPQFEARMRVLIAEPDRLWTPEYRKALATSRADFLALLVRLDATLTPVQRRKAQARLLALADEVRGLAQRRG